MKQWQALAFLAALLVGLYLIAAQRHCLRFQYTDRPTVVRYGMAAQQTREVVYLFGSNLCTICPSGVQLQEWQQQPKLYVFEAEVGDGEIQNFMETYQVNGFPIRGNQAVTDYLKRMRTCRGDAHVDNYHFTYDAAGRPLHIVAF